MFELDSLAASTAIYPLACAIITAAAAGPVIQIRFRAELRLIPITSGAVLISLAILPGPWAVLAAAAGMLTSQLLTQRTLLKLTFNVAKEVLAVTAASLALPLFGVTPAVSSPAGLPSPAQLSLALAAAALCYAIVDDLLGHTVLALASGVSWLQSARRNWDIVAAVRVANLALAVTIALVVRKDLWLIVAMPLTVLALQQATKSRIRRRADDEAWRRLAGATDRLNHTDLTTVLRSAVVQAPELFSADDAEIELRDATGGRLIRAAYDGPPGQAPEWGGCTITTVLGGHEGSGPVGELRLRFRTSVSLEQSEKYKLRTFASALATSIRNAIAYAELERVSDEHAYHATHDPLTGLANRRELLDRAGDAYAGRGDEGVLALLLIDLNHFKEVNDTLGHQAGDLVLCEVASRMQRAAQPQDLVARLGGDEFAVLFTGLPTPAMATHRAETLFRELESSVEVEGMRLTVEACGGIALFPGSGGVTEVLRRADVAMYQAKRSGRRITTYAHSRDPADVNRLVLGGELRRAIAEGEFVVDFQPIVDLGTGDVVSAEALARWEHPDHGCLTPMRFLETVERSDQLPAFADAVLEQSLSAVSIWREAGFDLPVAVNVSPRSLLDPGFPDAVLERLSRHAVAPDRLTLELAETLTISQLDVVGRALDDLRSAGVGLALDYFGSGVSSLSVLSRIPVHQLKIDRGFVQTVETSPEAAALIQSTVDLARSLRLVVVAEGVESEPQRRALFELGCVAGQGHLFARPMRADRVTATLQRGTAGRSGALAEPMHEAGSVVRMSRRRPSGHGRSLPHLHA
ncbi:putative bifunctional diguanylate cyclase/phosphodiesterase [Mangrovihabitans endophyticus]|uniref:Diguanylate cyclase (GGDEF) domain-containing protein n=1 Tax=Mangrovihabitans endophyticus TaxID=1751298 RepID=A0A8J3BYG2_9ACTN|nr:bifunctional diguanylate cyclase/phosphodiesterase [Mangrovihabitans endophyticus]GGK93599.1 hypothetical protein GCM10012284_29390 [Mangrovihabitans endophyticus]